MRLAVVWHGAVVRAGRAFLRCLSVRPDVDLTLIAPAGWSRALPHPVRFEPAEEPFRTFLYRPFLSGHGATAFAPGIGRLLGRVAPDALLAVEEPYGLLMGQIVRWKRRRRNPPFLVCFSYQNIEKRYPPPFAWIERAVFDGIDLLLGANPEVLEVARRKGYGGPAEVMPTAVDVETLVRSAGPGNAPSDEFLRIGYVGRLVEEKGIDTLLEAAARMEHPARIVIVGAGPQEAVLRRLAAPLGDRVRFLGPVPGDAVARVYAGLDVLVLPSRTRPHWKEQFGRVLVEAMACGVVVIGSDSGAIPWVIGDAGLVFPEGRPDGLAERLDTLARNPGMRESLARKGRERAAREFSAPVVAERLYGLFASSRPPHRR